jgi:hypothetical protein
VAQGWQRQLHVEVALLLLQRLHLLLLLAGVPQTLGSSAATNLQLQLGTGS